MSGHSHFATIKRQKAANDSVKGNIFSKMARAIMIAAKSGGDPDMNFRLRVEIDKARGVNMPKENIERAIAKATTEALNLEEISYEGFGPSGVNVIIEAATDNKNRTAQEIKNALDKAGGSLAGPGAVLFNFEHKGYLLLKKDSDPQTQMLKIIDMGVEGVEETDDGIEVYVASDKLSATKKILEGAGAEILETELQMKPKNPVEVSDDQAKKVLALLSALEDFDDVQKVFTNIK
ncbi:MAG: YebC/PmpR family DNA-binding transcriptional regulator [Patescibacteria group bacterium]